eukprot:824987-Rhodomonas_salina.1
MREAWPALPPIPPLSDHTRKKPHDPELLKMARTICHELPCVKLDVSRLVVTPALYADTMDILIRAKKRIDSLTNED